jgi:hypothetical protein
MKTVFIIGAGANVEIGMPSGDKLKEKIAEKLDFTMSGSATTGGDPELYDALSWGFNDKITAYKTAKILKEGLPFAISIDNFLDGRRNESDVVYSGKLAIVKSILEAEKKCMVHDFFYNNDNDKIKNTWYPLFLKKLTEGCDVYEFRKRLNHVAFIIFNYDRCFEYYLVKALQIYYHLHVEEAINIVNNMKIIHPYGIVGDRIDLGAKVSKEKLIHYAKNIRTFTEHSEETRKSQTSIKRFFDEASQIVFLGFAYHRLNLDLLFKYPDYAVTLADPAPLTDKVDYYGTGYEISEGDRRYIQDTLKKLDTRIKNCEISGDKCVDFFKNFWYRLFFQDQIAP